MGISFQPADDAWEDNSSWKEAGADTDEHSCTETAESPPDWKYQGAESQHGSNAGQKDGFSGAGKYFIDLFVAFNTPAMNDMDPVIDSDTDDER